MMKKLILIPMLLMLINCNQQNENPKLTEAKIILDKSNKILLTKLNNNNKIINPSKEVKNLNKKYKQIVSELSSTDKRKFENYRLQQQKNVEGKMMTILRK